MPTASVRTPNTIAQLTHWSKKGLRVTSSLACVLGAMTPTRRHLGDVCTLRKKGFFWSYEKEQPQQSSFVHNVSLGRL